MTTFICCFSGPSVEYVSVSIAATSSAFINSRNYTVHMQCKINITMDCTFKSCNSSKENIGIEVLTVNEMYFRLITHSHSQCGYIIPDLAKWKSAN